LVVAAGASAPKAKRGSIIAANAIDPIPRAGGAEEGATGLTEVKLLDQFIHVRHTCEISGQPALPISVGGVGFVSSPARASDWLHPVAFPRF
jgi:hypothetical protein